MVLKEVYFVDRVRCGSYRPAGMLPQPDPGLGVARSWFPISPVMTLQLSWLLKTRSARTG